MRAENHIAFKEWASVVNALAQGKQILILRKGGIREEGGEFRAEHGEFFLFPTYEHQNKADLKVEAHHDLDMVIQTKPDAHEIPIRYYAEVVEVIHIAEEDQLRQLEPYHVWSREAVMKRFHFGRQKGLFAMAVRIFVIPVPHLIAAAPEYAGCKSWVELKENLSTAGAKDVLSDADFQDKWERVSSLFLKSGTARQNHSDLR